MRVSSHESRLAAALSLAAASMFVLSGLGVTPGVVGAPVWAPREIATLNLGGWPTGVAVDPVRNLVFVSGTVASRVTNGSAVMNGITVINGSTGNVVVTISAGNGTDSLAVDSSRGRLYAADTGPGTVTVVDEATRAVVARVPVGNGPVGIAVNPSTGEVYVANSGSGTVSVIDGFNDTVVATIPVTNDPTGVAVDPSLGLAYVTASPHKVAVINITSNKVVRNIGLGDEPFGIAVNPSTHYMYAPLFFSKSLAVLNGSAEVASVALNGSTDSPNGVSVNPLTNTVYVTNRDSDTVSVIDGATNKLVSDVVVGSYPEGVAVNPVTGLAYVANTMSGTLSVVSSGPGPTSTDVTCRSSLFLIGVSTSCAAVVSGASPSGSLTWLYSGPGSVSFSPDTCSLSSGRCMVTVSGTGAGSVTVIASYGGDAINPASSGNFTLFVSNPARATADIVQHEYILMGHGVPQLSITLPSPVTKGDILVVGAVFGSNLSGSISDSLSNSWSGGVEPGNSYPTDYTYPNDPRLGTGMWWSGARADGNDTISIASNNSTMLVDVFEVRGANLSTAMFFGGLASPGTSNLVDYYSCMPSCFRGSGSFVFVLTGIDSPGAGTCFPENGTTEVDGSLVTQSPAFTIEPYCGHTSPLTDEQVIGDFDVTDAPGFTVALGVTPAYDGWLSAQIFAIDPLLNSSTSITTTTTATVTRSVTVTGPTATVTTTQTSTTTRDFSSVPTWDYPTMVILLITGLAVGYIFERRLAGRRLFRRAPN